MLGGYPLGARPLGSTPATGVSGTLAPYAAKAELADIRYLVCAEIEAESDDGPTTLRYASRPMPKDGIKARLDTDISISREVSLGTRGFEGLVETSLGRVTLLNGEGDLTPVVRDYSADGRPVRLRMGVFTEDPATGRASPPRLADCAAILEATGGGWGGGRNRADLSLYDLGHMLREPLQRERYGGTGGWDGDSELTDRTKPTTLGSCANVEVQIVDSLLGLGQVHSRRVAGIGRAGSVPGDLYEGGVPWRLQEVVQTPEELEAMALAGSIEPASYVVCLANGGVGLGSPPVGLITADVHGDATEAAPFDDGTYWSDLTGNIVSHWPGYVDTTCGVMLRILTAFMKWPATRFDEAGFLRADDARSGVIGYHRPAGDEITGDEALRELAAAAMLFAGPDPTGTYTVRAIEVPTVGAAVRTFGRHDRDLDTIDFEQVPYRAPPRAVRVLYDRNWAGAMRGSQVFEATAPSYRRWLEQKHRQVRDEAAAIKARFPTSEEWEHLTFFRYRVDAEAMRDLHLALYAAGRRVWTWSTGKALLRLDPGQIVCLADDDGLGLDATGVPLLVYRLTDEPAISDRRTTITAFG